MSTLTLTVPPDIEREIFEITVREFPGTGPLLCQVARRVNDWIQPLLYSVIIYRGINKYPALGKRASAERVRHLLIGGLSWDYQITWFLERCSNLRSLALWPSPYRSLPTAEVKKALLGHAQARSAAAAPAQPNSDGNAVGLTHLSVEWVKWFDTTTEEFKSPIFKDLTHLDLMDDMLRNWDQWKGLIHLPSLTHLAINKCYSITFLKHLLEKCEKLVVVVIITNTAWCEGHGVHQEGTRRRRQRRNPGHDNGSDGDGDDSGDESDTATGVDEEEELAHKTFVKEKITDGRLVFLRTEQAEKEWHNAARGVASFWDTAEDMAYSQMAKSKR